MSPLKSSNPITAGPECSNISEAHEKDLRTAFMNIIVVMNKDL